MKEAKEVFGKMLRWTEQPKNSDQAEKTIFIGAVVQGFYVNKRDNVGQNGSSVYEIKLMGPVQLPDGTTTDLVSFWGSDLIDGKFKEIPVGSEVRVSYLGISQPKTPAGRAYANFRIEYDASSRAPMAEAGHPADAAPAAAPAVAPTAAPAGAVAPAKQTPPPGY